MLNSQLRQSLNNTDGSQGVFASTTNSTQHSKLQLIFFQLVHCALLWLLQLFLSFSPLLSILLKIHSRTQSCRAWLTKGNFQGRGAGRNNCKCQEGAVTEGGMPLPSLFPHFQVSYLNSKTTGNSWPRPTSDLKHIPQTEQGKIPREFRFQRVQLGQ